MANYQQLNNSSVPPPGGQYGAGPPSGNQYAAAPPPGGQSGYGPPPGGQSGYGPPPVGQSGYGPPPGGQSGYGPPPSNQPGYVPQHAPPPANQSGSPPEDNDPRKGGHHLPEDNPNATEQASAPPMSNLPTYNGYGQASYHQAQDAYPPPSSIEYKSSTRPDNTSNQLSSAPLLSEQQARAALLRDVEQHCCYGKGLVEKMEITDIKPFDALHYKLDTFTESRKTQYAHTPYRGGIVDGPMNGQPPPPWSISVPYNQPFFTHVKTVEVPHTASVSPCFSCRGCGKVQCARCRGFCRIRCTSCNGHGETSHRVNRDGEWREEYKRCHWCHGRGRRKCPRCNGWGKVECMTCKSAGSLKHFLQLTVHFVNHADQQVVDDNALPNHLIPNAQGTQVFQEEGERVYCVPFSEGNWSRIKQASIELLTKHNFNNVRIWKQRHHVRSIPVNEVTYMYKDKLETFFVYGSEHRVWYQNYPDDCCCGCVIL